MEPKSAQKRAPPTPTVRPAIAQKPGLTLDMSHSATSTPAHGPDTRRHQRAPAAAPPPLPDESIGYRFTDVEVQERFVSGSRHGVLDAHLTAHLHMRRLDLSHGAAYRVKQIVARHAWAAPQGVVATNMCTTHICLTINFRPSVWQEGDVSDEEDGQMGAPSSSALGKIFGWHSPRMLRGDTLRGLDELSKTYVSQYSGLIPSKKQLTVDRCINVKPDDITASLRSLRQDAGPAARIVFHYSGHGVSRPRGNFLFLGHTNNAGENSKYTLDMIRSNVQYPLVFIADCQSAGSIFHYLCEVHRREDEQSMQHYRSSDRTQLGVPTSNGGGQQPGGLGQSSALQRSSVSALDLEVSSGDASGPGNDSSYPRSGRGYPPGSLTGSPVVAQMAQPFGGSQAAAQAQSIPVRDDFFFIGACKEALPFHPMLPNDWLTSCLTTPITMSLLWCIVTTRSIADIHPAFIHVLPGALEDKKSPLGQLRWAFDSFAESIAWSVLRSDQNLFTKLFRQDFLLSGLYRGALLAQRIVSQLNSEIVVYPTIHARDHEHHPLWEAFEYHVERALAALCTALQPQPSPSLSSALVMTQHYHKWQYSSLFTRSQSGSPYHQMGGAGNNQLSSCRAFREALDKSTALMTLAADRGIDHHLSPVAGVSAIVDASEVIISPHFLNEELTTLDATLDSLIDQGFYRFIPGGGTEMVPLLNGLPMIAQALLVLSHREDAIRLLCRFIDLGALAVEQLVELNLFSEALKNLWKHPKSVGHRPALMFLYAKAMYQDPAVLADDTRGVAIPIVLSFLSTQVPLSEMATNASSAWQISTLRGFATPIGQICLAAAITTMVCTRSPQGQTYCVQQGALDQCVTALATQCPPQSPPIGPRERQHRSHPLGGGGATSSYHSTGESTYVTNIEAGDLQVLLRLSLLAMLCSLVFNCPLQHDVTVGHFADLMLSCVPSLRGLLGYPFPSVRLAATRTIAIVLSHASIDATMEPSSPTRNNSSDNCDQNSEEESIDSSRRVRDMVCEWLQAILERSDSVTPVEANTDIRLEQLGILHSVLQRYGSRCIGGFSSQELQRRMAASVHQGVGPTGLQGAQASSVTSTFPVGSMKGTASLGGHEYPQRVDTQGSSMMSPFILPQTQTLSARTLHLDDSDDERLGQPTHKGPPRLPTTVPRSLPQRAFDAVVAFRSEQSPHRRYSESDLTAMLCSALRVVACAAADICPVVRGHAESSLSLLRSTQVIPREQMAWGVAASFAQRSVIDRNPSVGSKKPSGFFSFFGKLGNKTTQRIEPRATPPARGAGGGTGTGGAGYRYEDGIDEEDSPALRLVDHRDAATIHPLVFSVLSYLGAISLVPLDDHDPRNPVRAAIQSKTERYASNVMRGIEQTSRPQTYEPDPYQRKGALTLAPLIDRDVEAPVSALALHPTVPVVAVATNVDRLLILSYDQAVAINDVQQQRPKVAFHTSTLPRTWKEQCPPFVMPSGPSDPFSGFRASAYVQAQGQQAQGGGSSNFDNSDAESSDGSMALTPHAHHRNSLVKDHGGAPLASSAASVAATSSINGASPITALHFVDCHRPTPLIAAVHQNGAVAVVALNTELMSLHPHHPQVLRTNDPGTGANVVGCYAIRVSSFQTMPLEHRGLATSCVSTYHSASQQLHVTSPDGTISSWDLSVEQLVGLHNAGAAPHTMNHSLDLESSINTPYTHHQTRGSAIPTALGSHPLDPFRFVSGSRMVSVFDTRVLGGCVQRMLLPKSTAPATNSICWHVGFSVRCDHYLSAGYAFKGIVLTWDDRMNRTPLLHHAFTSPVGVAAAQAAPPTPMSQSAQAQQMFTPNAALDATCMDMHPTHIQSAVAAATTDTLYYHELGTGLMATTKCKGSPKCCVFHPLTSHIAVGTTANRVAVYRPAENGVSNIAANMLDV